MQDIGYIHKIVEENMRGQSLCIYKGCASVPRAKSVSVRLKRFKMLTKILF